MKKTEKKRDLLYLHVLITAALMFGFGFLPAPAPITPVGMKMIGIFLGLIYGWTFSSLAWPSLMGAFALTAQQIVTMKEFLPLSFANDTFVFLIFAFIFTAALEETGVCQYLANWCITRKVLNGNPWLLIFALMIGAMIASAFTNSFVAMLLFWGIFYNICEQAALKPYAKNTTLIIFGIMVGAVLGAGLLPFRTGPLVFLGLYASLSGVSVNFLQFFMFILPMNLAVIVGYLLICQFIFRMDVTPLKSVNIDFIPKESLIMTKKQKIMMFYLALFIFLAIIPSLLPAQWGISAVFGSVTTTGMLMLILMLLILTKIDGEALVNFSKLAQKGIMWDMMMLFMVVFPISSLLMAERTGIQAFLVSWLQPIFSSVSPLVFMIAVLALPTLITNFANNIVVGVIFANIICGLAAPLGVNATPLVVTLMICCALAFLTPAASAPVAMLFGNTEWVKAKDIYKIAVVTVLALGAITIAFGLVWGNIVF